MIGISFRILWRALILLLGIALAFSVIDRGLPYLDQYLPAWLVFLIIYIFFAYIGVPVLIRLWRMVIKPDHLPVYVTTGDGWASAPVNIAIVCKSRRHLVKSMEAAGWSVSAKGTLRNNLKTLLAIIRGYHYPEAPMSRLYLFGRSQDVGFQIQDGASPSPRHRHHVRFWKLKTPKKSDEHHDFWHNLMRLFHRHSTEVWIGAATHDVSPFALRMRNLQVTHQIDSDTNKERDFLIKTLKDNKGLHGETKEITSGHDLEFRGQTFGVNIIVDGRLKVVRLRK